MAAGLHILSRDVMWEYMNEVEDKFLFDEIFVRHEYLKNGIIISDGDTILDIGANIGMFSIYASCQASNLHIVAVEPIPPIFEVLSRNLQHCQLTCEDFSFTSISCAISSRDSASEKLTFYPEAPGESTRNVDERTSQHEKLVTCASVCDVEEIRQQSISKRESHLSLEYNIGTRTLKSLISEHSVKKVDLLKIDVEGDELDVIKSLEDAISIVRQMVIEVHDVDGRLENILQILSLSDFTCICERQSTQVSDEGFVSFVPPELALFYVYARR